MRGTENQWRSVSGTILGLMAVLFCATFALEARAAQPMPKSWEHPELMPLDEVELRLMPEVDVSRLRAEQAASEARRLIVTRWAAEGGPVPVELLTSLAPAERESLSEFVLKPGETLPETLTTPLEKPRRVGERMLTGLYPASSGTWSDLPGGGQVWRLKVTSPDALWLVLGFHTFRPAPGARLHVYDPDRATVLGPFTTADVREHRQLWMPPVFGDTLVVELYWPEGLRYNAVTKQGVEPDIWLGTVSHGYEDIGVGPGESYAPASGSCNIDVNCPLGNDWQDHKRGVVHLLRYGSSWCSASLVNTTDESCKPYMLTARHCIDTVGEAAGTSFRFNYERPFCGSGSAPTNQILTGSSLRATYSPTDVTLLEMDNPPLPAYNAYFNGWNRSPVASPDSTCIHHPSGDSKKISYNEDPLVNGVSYGSDHWRITQWELGTTEGGSSGSPLFDVNQRIVGQLHGGTASCSSLTWDEYGKFDLSWGAGSSSSSRLKDWLDPLGLAPMTMDGIEHDVCLNPEPQLLFDDTFYSDHDGNDNGFPEPGEGVTLQVSVKNLGNTEATGVSGTLTSLDPMVTVVQGSASWPDIPAGESEASNAPQFDLMVGAGHPCGEPIPLKLTMTYDGATASQAVDFDLMVGVPDPIVHFSDEIESGPNGWTAAGGWLQTTSDSTSPTHSWYVKDFPAAVEAFLTMPVTQDLPYSSRLLFQQRYDTQRNVDGGVLEYTIDGGGNWIDSAALFVANGYQTTIGEAIDSPLAGREVWSDDSGGWQQVELDLASLAGEDVQFRWRFATDPAEGGDGWYVDDVVIETMVYTCGVLLPGEASDPRGSGDAFAIERRSSGQYDLSWSEPVDGAAPAGYKLYRTGLGQFAPECEADLGISTSIMLNDLTAGSGFVVVPVNEAGEGSYGRGSDGNERQHAQGPEMCP